MFKINDSDQKPVKSSTSDRAKTKAAIEAGADHKIEAEPTFKSLAEFNFWLDGQLEALVECFSDFETKHSLRGYFARK